MIGWMLRAREVIKSFYEKYDRYIEGVFRFMFALSIFLTVMYHTGYNVRITSPWIAIIMALICAFLPISAIPIFTGILLTMEFASVSPELAAITVIILLIMLLTYFVFKAGDSWLLAFSMLMLLWGFSPVLLPVALFIQPIQIIVVVFGVILYALIIVVKKDASVLSSSTGSLTLGGRVNLLLNDLVTNQRFLLILLILSTALLLICLVRRSRISYAPLISAVAGGVLYMIGMLLGDYFLSAGISVVRLLVGALLAAAETFVIINFVISVDYNRTEQVQFEDDEYYYYVKAVPKVSIGVTEKKVESITGTGTVSEKKGETG